MNEERRLIEVAFPLKQTSLDSVHEKNVRHGHISTLHIWPARRPLAASRAALIATLLPDPGNAEERKQMLERLGGRLVTRVKTKKLPDGRIEEQTSEETEGGILHWGRESSADLDWFREKIRAAYGGRAPKVLDPFAGGGAIPLEAMRLGCDVTAIDINPVAWFILKCTLEYPQRLANQTRPLPAFARQSPEFMEQYFKAKGFKGVALRAQLASLGFQESEASSQPTLTGIKVDVASVEADLAWHVRAWGWWVLQQAKADLERFYPIIDGKPTVAYLWARTITCKNCRATIPLLKTRWLCKKDKKRVVLTIQPNSDKTGVIFGVQEDVPLPKGTLVQRGEAEKRTGGGTMSGSGASCPCCGTIMTMEDIRLEGQAGRIGMSMTVVVVDGQQGKEYRLPSEEELRLANEAERDLSTVFAKIPFGLPEEATPGMAGTKRNSSSLQNYGVMQWRDLFTSRQLLALGSIVNQTRAAFYALHSEGYPTEWSEAIYAYLTRCASISCKEQAHGVYYPQKNCKFLRRETMNLDDFIITCFCLIDEMLPGITKGKRLRERGPMPKLADSEVVTIEVVGTYLGLSQDQEVFDYFRRHYAHFFPVMAQVDRTTFVRQAANLWAVKERLWCLIRDTLLLYDPSVAIVDSMPIPVCQFARAYRCHRFDDTASFGKDHTCRQTFYGFRLHMRLCWPGVITRMYLAPANVHEGEVVWDLTAGTSGLLLGDRNYWLPTLQATLRKAGIILQAPFRKASSQPAHSWSAVLGRVRYRIDTVFGQLTDRCEVKRVWARDLWHLRNRVLRMVLMHTLCVLFNLQDEAPPLQLDRLVA